MAPTNKDKQINAEKIAELIQVLGLDTDDMPATTKKEPKTWKERAFEAGKYALKKAVQVGGSKVITNVFGEPTNQPSGDSGITLGGIQETAFENEMFAKLKEKDIMDEALYGSEDDPYNFYQGLNVRNVYKTKGGKMVDYIFKQKLEDIKEKSTKKQESVSIGKNHSAAGLFGRVRKGSSGYERHNLMGLDIQESIENNWDFYNKDSGWEDNRNELLTYIKGALDIVPLKSEPLADGTGSYRLKMPSAVFEHLSEKYPWITKSYQEHIATPSLEGVKPYGVEILRREGTDIIYRPLTKTEGEVNRHVKHTYTGPYERHDEAIMTDDIMADIVGDEKHIAASSSSWRVSKGIKDDRDEIEKQLKDRDGTYEKQKNIAILADYARIESASPDSIKKLAAGIVIFHPEARKGVAIDPNKPVNIVGAIDNIIRAFPHGTLIGDTVRKIKPNPSLAKELKGNEAQMKSGVDNWREIIDIMDNKGNVAITNLPGELRAFWNWMSADPSVGGLRAAPSFLDSALSKLNIPLLTEKQKENWAQSLTDKIPVWAGDTESPNYAIFAMLKKNLVGMQEAINKGIQGHHSAMHQIFKKLSKDERYAFENYIKVGGEINPELATKLGESWEQMQEIQNRAKLQARLTMFIFQAAVIFQGGSGGKAVSDQDRKFVEKALQAGRFGTEEGLRAAVNEIGLVLNKIYVRTHTERRAALLGYDTDQVVSIVEPVAEILANPYAKELLVKHTLRYRNEKRHNPTQKFEDVKSELTDLGLSLEELANYKRGSLTTI